MNILLGAKILLLCACSSLSQALILVETEGGGTVTKHIHRPGSSLTELEQLFGVKRSLFATRLNLSHLGKQELAWLNSSVFSFLTDSQVEAIRDSIGIYDFLEIAARKETRIKHLAQFSHLFKPEPLPNYREYRSLAPPVFAILDPYWILSHGHVSIEQFDHLMHCKSHKADYAALYAAYADADTSLMSFAERQLFENEKIFLMTREWRLNQLLESCYRLCCRGDLPPAEIAQSMALNYNAFLQAGSFPPQGKIKDRLDMLLKAYGRLQRAYAPAESAP